MRDADLAKLDQLAEPFRSRVRKVLETASDVWINSGFRSQGEQVQLRRAHCGTTFYDIWQKPASQCNPPTAIPGRSQHERGMAVDFGGNLDRAERLAREIGLESNVSGEPWHFEMAGGSAGVQGIRFPLPGGGIDIGPEIPNPIGLGIDQVEDAIGGVLEELVEPVLGGLYRIALTGALLAGGVGLVVLGGIRSTRSGGGGGLPGVPDALPGG